MKRNPEHLDAKSLPTNDSPPEHLRYIAIEGVIGVGKTSLAQLLSRHFNAHLVLEQFEENPFLERFYENPGRWAFQTQLAFLASRFRQQKILAERDLFHSMTVSDYAFDKDRIFAHETLEGDELALYDSLFRLMEPSTPEPNLLIFLQSSTDRLMQNIRERGRPYEAGIERAYIERLNAAYDRYFRHYRQSALLIVRAAGIDFVKNPADLEELIRQITRITYRGTTIFKPPSQQSG